MIMFKYLKIFNNNNNKQIITLENIKKEMDV